MRILGIESSCDETAVSVIEVIGSPRQPRVRVLANVVSSQVKLHAKFGGVVPNLAKREHQRNFVPVLLSALREGGGWRVEGRKTKQKRQGGPRSTIHTLRSILNREPELLRRMEKIIAIPAPKIDAIAVTVGPGLAPALWVGVNFARALSYLWGKPLIPVNHLEGHITVNLLKQIDGSTKHQIPNTKRLEFGVWSLEFPAIALLVSGGHTELVLMEKRVGDYRVIGETRDDAAGEAFDKVAKMLGLGFPGGPIISKLAEWGDAATFSFPRPMMREQNFDFSFSGLKTAVLYTLEKLEQKEIEKMTKRKRGNVSNFSFSSFLISNVCASFQAAAVDVLVAKTMRAAKQYRVKTVMLGGGVAANSRLRMVLGERLRREFPATRYLLPAVSLTGDNALMIALAGWFNRKKKRAWTRVQARADLRLDASRPKS